ncbi:Glycoside hydrolase, family 28 [Cynara cardunculus var. scolymus]|uniref:endo-polygalacturonase n=1 Tax=Cynara cardunculus var. scolymus TaxID=59895 RepID=A0A103Y1F8_CYNCS|nr:Glycoside hydrolase, family 28 [Cynara cardunculus var. scolymus]
MHLHKHLMVLLVILGSTISCSSYINHHHPAFNQVLPAPPRTLLAQDQPQPQQFNVDDYGATANGTDDSQAFMEAWRNACNSSNGTEFVVPENKVYHLKPITFSGPCNPNLRVKVYGTIKASSHRSDYDEDRRHWITFEDLDNFFVEGGGTINGNGRIWWIKSCKVDDTQNLRLNNIRIKNPQQIHLTIQNSTNVIASNLRVIAPANSPNTDGFHISGSKNVQIMDSIARTGDDCVSIVNGSSNVVIRKIVCGPGHGISIGSLGKNNSEDFVSNVLVDKVVLTNTTNGVRIKSWQGGSGYAKNIKFQNIIMRNVTNPIIVDQNYCDRKEACPEQDSAVQMQNVVYRNIRGTSNSEVAINFDCSKTFPCRTILLDNIVLNREGDEGDTKASCSNVMLATRGEVAPNCE